MTTHTISEISRDFRITTRTLRYYDQIQLLPSRSKPGYAYRTYSDEDIAVLKKILFLRQLAIPLRDITEAIQEKSAEKLKNVLRKRLDALTGEIGKQESVRHVLMLLLRFLQQQEAADPLQRWIDQNALFPLTESATCEEEAKRAKENLMQTAQQCRSVPAAEQLRIVFLPPAEVASIHDMGRAPEPEDRTSAIVDAFIRDSRLWKIKPDFRHYGFNHPDGCMPDGNDHGYERWLTIPEGLELPEPFIRKHFPGGIYAAQMIPMGDFDEWQPFAMRVKNHPDYSLALGEAECGFGCMEEHLNYINMYNVPLEKRVHFQLDLLIPVVLK